MRLILAKFALAIQVSNTEPTILGISAKSYKRITERKTHSNRRQSKDMSVEAKLLSQLGQYFGVANSAMFSPAAGVKFGNL